MKPLIVTVLALGLACSAGEPDTKQYDAKVVEDTGIPDAPQGCPPASTLTLSVESYPDPTCYTLQPFRGQAKGADRVVAQGGAGAAQPVTVSADGSFCIEVLLNPDSLNTITFSPVDADGCPGQDLVRTIEHKTCAQPDASVGEINVAKGAGVTTDATPSAGSNTDLVDGKTDTVVEYEGGWGWTDAGIWVGVALGQPVELEKVVVRWRDSKGNGCAYGASYKIAISAYSAPGKMDLNSGTWTELEDVSGGDGGEDSFTLASPKPLAQHVALLLNKDGCTGWSETFALAELEIWARDSGTPAPPPDRCLK